MATIKKHKLGNKSEPPFKRFKKLSTGKEQPKAVAEDKDLASFLASDSDSDSNDNDNDCDINEKEDIKNVNDLMPDTIKNDSEINDLINMHESNESIEFDGNDENDENDDFFIENKNQDDGDMIDEFDFDNSNDDNDDNMDSNEELLAIEESALLDKMNENIEIDEKANLREMRQEAMETLETDFVFPTPKQLAKEKNETPDLKLLKQRIEDVIEILGNFKTLRDGKHSRKDYVSLLSHSLCRYYGYSLDLMNMFLALFNPAECLAFLEANEQSRPVTIRTNTLKIRRRELAKILINERGINLDPLADWTKEGLTIVNSEVPIGATPEYLAGYYMIQSAASLLPVMALDIHIASDDSKKYSKSGGKHGFKVLDMSAAPGGKTTHIGQLMKGFGTLVANDVNKERLKAVYGNIHRMGLENCVILNEDGRQLHKHYNGIFDRVLLDAPCSCLGVISRDSQIKYKKSFKDVTTMSTLQKELILSAIDCCKVGGVIVYSTCSVSPYENEGVVYHALSKRYVKIVDTKLPFGTNGFSRFKHFQFDASMQKTKRYYPHSHNLDGFYVAKLIKTDKGERGNNKLIDTSNPFADSEINDNDTQMGNNEKTKQENEREKKLLEWGLNTNEKYFENFINDEANFDDKSQSNNNKNKRKKKNRGAKSRSPTKRTKNKRNGKGKKFAKTAKK